MVSQDLKQEFDAVQKLCKRSVLDIALVNKDALGRLLQFRQHLGEALAFDPKNTEMLRMMASVHCYLLNFSEAAQCLTKVYEQSRDSLDAKNLNRIRQIDERMKHLSLSIEQLYDLRDYIDVRLGWASCDHTLKYTMEWLQQNMAEELHNRIVRGLQVIGCYCDCEVLSSSIHSNSIHQE